MKYTYVDLHCHSILKSYSKSFKVTPDGGKHSKDSGDEHSAWHQKKPSLFDKLGNFILSITKFTQSDFTTSFNGGVQLLLVSIDPMEKRLVLSRNGKPQNFLGRLIKNFIIGIGIPRIKYLTHKVKDDYYSDLLKSRDYLEQLNDTPVLESSGQKRYSILKSLPQPNLPKDRLHIIYSIEGGHVFNTNTPQVMEKVNDIKTWLRPPCWVSLAHHFPNRLCGQAKSFKGLSRIAYKQGDDPNLGLTELGEQVAKRLLAKSPTERRILIDVKHMNLKSRRAYFAMANTLKVPIVVSHGALMFENAPNDLNSEINFYDDEIFEIARSGGLFGIQLDQRRIKQVKKLKTGNKPIAFKINRDFRRRWKAKTGKRFKKRLYRRAYYIWKQASHMAELLDGNPQFNGSAWQIQAIGSDFDGIVDPLDGFWTHSDFNTLAHYIELNIENYIARGSWKDLKPKNQLDAETLCKKLFSANALDFIHQHFN